MPLVAYRRKSDGKIFHCFENEAWDRLPYLDTGLTWGEEEVDAQFDKLPPNPVTINSTRTFMSEHPQLDSFSTIYELDKQLTLEAEQEREDKAYQELVVKI